MLALDIQKVKEYGVNGVNGVSGYVVYDMYYNA